MKCFSKIDISNELSDLFSIEKYFSDIDGTPFSNQSNNLTIVSKKINFSK